MKIDKRNPAHWCYLVRFGLNVVLALCLRPFVDRPVRPLVLLYGHKLTGNLKALYDALRAQHEAHCDVRFLTMDRAYHATLLAAGEAVVLASTAQSVSALARASVIVSDHGLHVMSWLPRLTSIRFVDVWHGVPYKGWDASDFRALHGYDEIWVSSALIRRSYIERFGFRPAQVHVTGYGRTDRLVRQTEDAAALRQSYGLQASPTKIVLCAPTWHHDGAGPRDLPFGVPVDRFLGAIGEVCHTHGAQCVFRAHLNSRLSVTGRPGVIVQLPQERFPDTEGLLLISDVLICDWSSIAFDYLVLNRPTIFLDIPAPFPKGFTLGPEYRFGALAATLDTLCTQLDAYLGDPESYLRDHETQIAVARAAAFDDYADGHATDRYIDRLRGLL